MITDRIKELMEAENLTPARFADLLEVGRAVVSHILNGRNNPSLDVITRILSKMPDISSEWLLQGTGEMYKSSLKNEVLQESESKQANFVPDLFSQDISKAKVSSEPSQNQINTTIDKEERKNIKEKQFNTTRIIPQRQLHQRVKQKDIAEKKIKQIIIYYSDNTFETFAPE